VHFLSEITWKTLKNHGTFRQKSPQLLKKITAIIEGKQRNFCWGLTTTGTTKDIATPHSQRENIYLAHKLAARSRRKKLSQVVQVVLIKT
jgi:hypothetical protein